MRIAVIHVSQETNDFNPVPTTLRDYEAFGIFEGRDILEKLREQGQIGGHLEAVGNPVSKSRRCRSFAASQSPAGGSRGKLSTSSDRIRTVSKPQVRSMGLRCNFMALARPRGSTSGGAQMELCRSILGDDIPIVLGLDHHANVTQKIIDNSTAIVGHRTQPHDPFDTGKIGTELLLKIDPERQTRHGVAEDTALVASGAVSDVWRANEDLVRSGSDHGK